MQSKGTFTIDQDEKCIILHFTTPTGGVEFYLYDEDDIQNIVERLATKE